MATNGPSLREYVEQLFKSHQDAHHDHEGAHAREHAFAKDAIEVASKLADSNKEDADKWRATADSRERTFATKVELQSVVDKADRLDQAEIRRAENERLRLITEAEEKRNMERAQTRQQWLIGLAVGIAAVGVNLLIRLLTP